jgi:hypothetical protein
MPLAVLWLYYLQSSMFIQTFVQNEFPAILDIQQGNVPEFLASGDSGCDFLLNSVPTSCMYNEDRARSLYRLGCRLLKV